MPRSGRNARSNTPPATRRKSGGPTYSTVLVSAAKEVDEQVRGSGNGGGGDVPEAEDAECEECGEEPSTLLRTECGVRYCDECEAATHDHLRAKRGEDHCKFVKRDVKGGAKGGAVT